MRGNCLTWPARLGLMLVAAAILLDCAALALDIFLGRKIVAGEPFNTELLETSSALSSRANIAVPAAVALAGLLFVLWFYCSYRRFTGVYQARLGAYWALLGWVVPLINLVRPPSIMSELLGSRHDTSSDRGPILVWFWWALWIIGACIQVALRFIRPETQQGWVDWQVTAFVGNLYLLGALVCILVLMGRVVGFRRVGPASPIGFPAGDDG